MYISYQKDSSSDIPEYHFPESAVSRTRSSLILVGDRAFWQPQKGQLLAELFAIAQPLED